MMKHHSSKKQGVFCRPGKSGLLVLLFLLAFFSIFGFIHITGLFAGEKTHASSKTAQESGSDHADSNSKKSRKSDSGKTTGSDSKKSRKSDSGKATNSGSKKTQKSDSGKTANSGSKKTRKSDSGKSNTDSKETSKTEGGMSDPDPKNTPETDSSVTDLLPSGTSETDSSAAYALQSSSSETDSSAAYALQSSSSETDSSVTSTSLVSGSDTVGSTAGVLSSSDSSSGSSGTGSGSSVASSGSSGTGSGSSVASSGGSGTGSGSSGTSEGRKTDRSAADSRQSKGRNSGGGWTDTAKVGGNFYFCTYEGVKHNYILDLPERTQGAPIILMLHGHGGDADSFRHQTGLYQEAVAQGYIVIHATAGPNPSYGGSANRWNHDEYGGKNDVGFLIALVSRIRDQYHADPSRCFAVGFSNGAYMAHRLAIDAPDVFSAVVSVEGAMADCVWDRRPGNCRVGVFQITGTRDVVVPQYSYKRPRDKKLPAIEDVMEYYAIANELYGEVQTTVGNGCVLSMYKGNNAGNPVWHLVIPNGGHHWLEEGTGINTNRMVLMYLSKCRHQ